MNSTINGNIPPRYTNRTFPPYRHIPGETPHPVGDPTGHSYDNEEDHLSTFSSDDWQNCHPYLYGIDLINNNYWWEAHEALEQVWFAAGKNTITGAFMQGLIQVAVAQLKRYMGSCSGAKKLTESGINKLSTTQGIYLGIDVALLVADANRCLQEDAGEFPRIILNYDE